MAPVANFPAKASSEPSRSTPFTDEKGSMSRTSLAYTARGCINRRDLYIREGRREEEAEKDRARERERERGGGGGAHIGFERRFYNTFL